LRGRGQPARYVNRRIDERMFSIVMIGPLAGGAADARAAAGAEGVTDSIEVSL